LFPFSIRQPIPLFSLPLQSGDQEPTVNLGRLLHELYDQAGYDLRLNYGAEPPPPLDEADVVWVEGVLGRAGLR
jgi:hypothetical protein